WWLSFFFGGPAGAGAATLIHLAIDRFGLASVLLAIPVGFTTCAAHRVWLGRVNAKIRETDEMARLHLATVEALATAIDAKDQTTHCHVRRLQLYARGMATLLKLPASEVEALKAGSLLHDIGKLAIPDLILNEPGKLSPADFEKMKMHTVVGAQILERVNFPYPVVPIVRHHHEQWDGQGYPDNLRGREIPVAARILSVIDCYDSVREDRPYRRGMTRPEAIAVLRKHSGTRFDPQIVELFIDNLDLFEAEISAAGLDEGLATEGEDCFINTAGEAAIARPLTHQRKVFAPSYLNQIKEAQHEVYAFYEIARTFSSSLNLENTFAILADKISHIVPCETCALYLYDETSGSAVVAHAAGKNADALRAHAVSVGDGAIGNVLARRLAQSLSAPNMELAGVALGPDSADRAMALVPLTKGERLIGALAIYTAQTSAYTGEHMRLLDTLARLASDAVANAIRHSEVEANSLTDVLTGLPNARCLYLQFEQEVARAPQPFSFSRHHVGLGRLQTSE
ncbi:MAG: HD domain-containing phosphohydrolase, partial [Pyrinomonadaceae bacterium]